MDTSSFKANEVGEFRTAINNQGQAESDAQGDTVMSDDRNVIRPFRRAVQGVISLLSGDLDDYNETPINPYFEKVRVESSHTTEQSGFNRFHRALRRIRYQSQFNPNKSDKAPLGTFGGRHIIGESTPINGGVYLGAAPQEALVVDDRHGALERLYNELVVRLAEVSIDRRLDEREILPEVAGLVVRRIRFSESETRELTERENINPDEKVAIDMYLHEQVGVARHQMLLVAYLIERLKKRGVLNGCLMIDSISAHSLGHDDRLIYTSPHGYLFIFDALKLAR